jgi:hypothetical protein
MQDRQSAKRKRGQSAKDRQAAKRERLATLCSTRRDATQGVWPLQAVTQEECPLEEAWGILGEALPMLAAPQECSPCS